MDDVKFDLRDISIVPTVISDISSRSECKTTHKNGLLPLMTAPMDTVVCNKNVEKFIENNIVPCMPRGEYYPRTLVPDNPVVFQAYGLSEIEYDLQTLEDNQLTRNTTRPQYWYYKHVLIDIANGHMQKLIDVLKLMKVHTPEVKVMVGNVAHPLTYKNLAMAGADYVRCSIGTGCFTPGQIIKLKDNEKNIEDIQIGDKVLTHKNKYQEVKTKFEYEIEEEIYKVNNIFCTKTHEFYIIETQYKNIVNNENIQKYAKWISAEQLDKEKHLLIEY